MNQPDCVFIKKSSVHLVLRCDVSLNILETPDVMFIRKLKFSDYVIWLMEVINQKV